MGSTLDTAMEGNMRVSVVATGIDATDVQTDIPVPRRSMAAPLTSTVSAEAPAPEADPIPAPAPAAVAAAAEEPMLFEGLDVQKAAAEDMAEDIFADETPVAAEDDLPPPAYQPQVAAFEPTQDTETPPAEEFVAPRAPAPGTPSPEALARLRAATQRASGGGAAPQQPEAAAEAGADKPRFGINSLINRMTGAGEAPAGAPQQPAPRQQPPVQTARAAPAPQPTDATDPDQERIEIPAFLRRQAN